jgi:hypothetical protein
MMALISNIDVPDWLQVPQGYAKILSSGGQEFGAWKIITNPILSASYNLHLSERYPHLTLFMFAKRNDNDTIATFSRDAPGKVILINDFSTKGWEYEGEFNSFWEWFDDMIAEFKQFEM